MFEREIRRAFGEQEDGSVTQTAIFIRNMVAGGVSASIAVTAMAPIERIKLILQVQAASPKHTVENQYKGLMDAFIRIPKEQGYLSFWRGNLASVIRGFPYQALNFAFRDKYKDYFSRGYDKKSQFWHRFCGNLLSGGIAGSTSMALIYPLDYARTRMAMDFGRNRESREFRSIRHCLSEAFQKDGIRGLYRGFTFSLFGVFIYRAAYFGLFDSGKDLTPEEYRHTLVVTFLTAEMAATISGLISYPFDTVRRSMMMQSGTVGSKHYYTSSRDCIQKLYARKGARSFFNGAWTNVIRGTGGALMLVLYDEIQHDFFKHPHRPSADCPQVCNQQQRSDHERIGVTCPPDPPPPPDYVCQRCREQAMCPVRRFAERVKLICDF